MERNYSTAGFGDLRAGTGWSYDRSAKASLLYGSSRSSHPDSELLHCQTYGPPYPLRAYTTNHHPGSSRQSGTWGPPGRTIGLSGLFDTSLHHASTSGPDPAVINLISALESQGPQITPSSSLLSQFRSPSWQPTMHTPGPAELFISGAIPGSGSFPSSSSLSAYQHPGSFPGPSLPFQDAPTYNPTSNGLLSPHDSPLHIKTPSQSSLGFDHLFFSQSATYKGSQESPAPQNQISSDDSNCQLPPAQFNLLSSQLHNRHSQLCASSMFSSSPTLLGATVPQPQSAPERVVSREDSVIKHYQRSPPTQSTAHQYISCGGSSRYQLLVSQHQNAGMPCSPLDEQSLSTDPKPSPQSYQPTIQTPYTTSPSSSSVSSSSTTKGPIGSSSNSGYSTSGSSSSTHTAHNPPPASSSSSKANSISLPTRFNQQHGPQLAPAPPLLPVVSSSLVQQPPLKQCLTSYGSQSVVKSSTIMPNQTSPSPHVQSYSPTQVPSAHMAQSFGGFTSPSPKDLSSGEVVTGGKAFTSVGSGRHCFAAEIVFGDSNYGSASLNGARSPLEYGNESSRLGPLSGAATERGGIESVGSGSATPVAGNESKSSYHLPESSTSPVIISTLSHSTLHSPAAVCPSLTPGSSGGTKYLSSILSPASPESFPNTRQTQSDTYHSTPTKPKPGSKLLAADRSRVEAEETEDFLFQHLLQSQTATPHHSQHHSHSQQLSQRISQASERKGMSFDINKLSNECHHSQSVIRTNNSTNHSDSESLITETANDPTRQLESTQKKQQTMSELTVSKCPAGEGQEVSKSLSYSLVNQSNQQQHESLDSVVQYERGDSYTKHPHHQHSYHLHMSPYSQQHAQYSHQIIHQSRHSKVTQHSQHSQHCQANFDTQNNQCTDQKNPSITNDKAHLCNTPDLLQARQSQAPLSLTNPPDPSQTIHVMQSAHSHTPCTKLDLQQVFTQQHQPHNPLSQPGMIGTIDEARVAGVESDSQNLSPQLPLPLQNQRIDSHYRLATRARDQLRTSQNSIPRLEMLDQSLPQANNIDSSEPLDGIELGMTVPGIEGGGRERYTHQHRLTPQHHSQQKLPDLHNLLAEPDLGLSTSSHLHHLNPPSAHTRSHAIQGQHAHIHQQVSHEQLGHLQPHGMSANMAPPHHPQQSQQRQHEAQLPHSQLDQLKQHQFDIITPGNKVGLDQTQQQQRFPPLPSVCFPDSLLQDEDRSFFPEVENMFCSSEYKSNCAGNFGAGQAIQETLNQSCGQSQEDVADLKVGGAGEGFGLGNHHTDQIYGQYCHTLPGTGKGNLHLDLDAVKSYELPSTVNTDQLGFIQSQNHSIELSSAAQGDVSANKIVGAVVGSSSTTGLTSPIFCSSRPKKLLKTSSFHLLKQRCDPQPKTKKNYPQEYEFEDDEDKADAPADIRLNSRRLPDLLPDLVSSCRRATGLSPMTSDIDFCHPTTYTLIGHNSHILSHDGPKKRGRKPTKPKREGPPRPRGRPRIRPLSEPPYCRGLMGLSTGETKRGRGRGRGRGRREEGLVKTHRNMNKAQNLSYQQQHHHQQQYTQRLHVQHPQQYYSQQADLHQAPHKHVEYHQHLQQEVSFSHQLHHHQLYEERQQHTPQQDLAEAIKMKQPHSTMPPSESLVETDSLSSWEPVLSDGSVGSAPSLGMSPGPSGNVDIGKNDHDETQDNVMKQQHRAGEMMVCSWKKETDHGLNPESWADLQKLTNSADDKDLDFKPGFMAFFLDFLKTGKKESDLVLEQDEVEREVLDACSSLKGGIRPLSSSPPSLPPPSPQTLPEDFSRDRQSEEGTELVLPGCPRSCKPLDEELKRNLETLPSFSSDEEDSMSKNQDLQKSISSAISALYDTPHSLAAVMASAIIKIQPTLSPLTHQGASVSPPLPTGLPDVATVENIKEEPLAYGQQEIPRNEDQRVSSTSVSRLKTEERDAQKWVEEEKEEEERGDESGNDEEVKKESENLESQETEVEEKLTDDLEACNTEDPPPEPLLSPVPSSQSPSAWRSPLIYSSASPLHTLSLSALSSLPIQQGEDKACPVLLFSESQPQPSSYHQASTSPPPSTSPPAIQSSPLSSLPQSIPPPSTTPPPSSSDQDLDYEASEPSSKSASSPSLSSSEPPSPPTPEETQALQRLTSLHLAKKQADAAIAGESAEEDSGSEGEGIFRERDEFVVRIEDIGTLKMALQTGREPPPIWRVQKALLQKFSPEIKDGQRQFCATSNYLGYFGDAKMCYQRLYVKFLENINKKDYVRVCSRKPWHRAGLALRRQSLTKQVQSIQSQNQSRVERDDRDKERQKEKEMQEQRAREKERERVQRGKIERELKERERREKEKQEREHKEKEKTMREQEEREQKQREFRGTEKEMERMNEQKGREEREREGNNSEREQKEKRNREKREEKQDQEFRERLTQEKELKEKEQKDKEERREILKQPKEMSEKQSEQKGEGRRNYEKEKRQGRDNILDILRVKEEKRGEGKKSKIFKDRGQAPPKKRKKWLKEVPSSSSESDSSRPSDDEGPVWGSVRSRAMREMFKSYVEMLVSTALDPDMIQALEDTDDELYLPPMRKIDSLLSEQKKRLLRRINMNVQHQEVLHMYPKMTADPLESGAVRVHLHGEGYSRKTLSHVKKSVPKQQDIKLSIETCRFYSLYHSLHHYKYHTFLHCKKETDNIEQTAEDPGQEEVVQQCMANQAWLEKLFSSFVELLTLCANT
ncbi:proline-rich protein 12-like isoform X2 [Poeciliopsis prolifica]|uniref:proline-rich protein 12-like isoform X2 n=1 Tax=Poeciliopsis prolifica TaxID=188132 RepID=UPI002413219E|nr:proline-rich protein 12-like isoform X2 [Poeciliopsis prolifica]